MISLVFAVIGVGLLMSATNVAALWILMRQRPVIPPALPPQSFGKVDVWSGENSKTQTRWR